MLWLLSAVALLIVALGAWVSVRGLMAKSELEAVVPLASSLKNHVVAQDAEKIDATAVELTAHASQAARLTSDPLWRATEILPGVGPNLVAFRQLASVVDGLSKDAVGPLADLATSINVADLKPEGGVMDLAPLKKARPIVARAENAVDDAQKATDAIETESTISQVRDAKAELETLLASVAGPLEAIRTASILLPDMLGGEGPRDFLVLFQNPAELRATGGIPGALALVRVDAGQIGLVQQAAASEFPRFSEPVLPLTTETRGLYGEIAGQYMQNVNLMPHFPVSAALAREMWARQFGTEVHGVLSIDPIALSYLLEATGPISLATGDVLSAENAVPLLLRDAYIRYPEPEQQDVFFAAAASAVFDSVTGGDLDPMKFIGALTRAGEERRILVWSAIESEQAELHRSALAGNLPKKTEQIQPFGVYLNDATAAKMDFYLDVRIAHGQITCRKDARPQFGVTVVLANTAPLDSPLTFPDYVTGGAGFGVQPGNIKTLLNVYGDSALQNLGVTRDEALVPYLPATDSGYQVSQIAIELAPGESVTLQFGFLGEAPFSGEIVVEQTPVINRHETKEIALTCESPLW